jgi:2-iminobutanoate/2-iminopropanoate deaminase
MKTVTVTWVNTDVHDEPTRARPSSRSDDGQGSPGWTPIATEISSHLPFTPAVEANGFVFVSGQASVDATGAIISGTFEEEMRLSMANVESVLASAGLTLRDVVRVTSYVRDTADGPSYNEIYRDYFRPPLPARTTISNCLSPALRFEIDVIAVRPN